MALPPACNLDHPCAQSTQSCTPVAASDTGSDAPIESRLCSWCLQRAERAGMAGSRHLRAPRAGRSSASRKREHATGDGPTRTPATQHRPSATQLSSSSYLVTSTIRRGAAVKPRQGSVGCARHPLCLTLHIPYSDVLTRRSVISTTAASELRQRRNHVGRCRYLVSR